MASHDAARRAVQAGYTDVSVMVDGITGWDAQGEPHVDPDSGQASNM
jgi:rhodanese-related sulfurtransferase